MAAALVSGFDPTIGYNMSLSRTLVLLPFFAAGHLAAGGGLAGLLPQLPRRGVIAALSGWIALAGTLLWLRRGVVRSVWFYASRSYEGAHYDPELRALLLFTGAAWIALLLLIVPKRPLPFAAALGQYTLPVFLLHGFFVRSLRLLRPDLPPLMGIGLAVLAALTLCAILGNRFTASLLRPTFCAPQLNRPVLKPRPSRTRHPAR